MLTMSCSAELRLDRALARRYRWPRDFPGFEASARLSPGADAGSAVDAVVRVPTSGAPHLLAPIDAADASMAGSDPCGAARVELLAAIDGLVDGLRRPWVLQACLPWPKQSEQLKAGRGELPRVADPARTTLRLTDGHLAEVHRDRGDHRVAWRIDRWFAAPGGRVVPASMLVTVDDRTTGRALWFERVNDEYDVVDGVLVPTRRRTVRWLDHRRGTTELRLMVPTVVR